MPLLEGEDMHYHERAASRPDTARRGPGSTVGRPATAAGAQNAYPASIGANRCILFALLE
ncbi:hypothetical protein WT72_28675 [Burkholderia pseudomultivorans]|nr:hypothetical protein WT72_28675 [Burkholderia pseudomultivorans]